MRILIVEDNQADQELLLELLQDQFMQQAKFRVANDLRGAIDYLQRRHSSIMPRAAVDDGPYFHCVLLDLGLPDSKGRDTFRAIHSKHPTVPIIIISNNLDPDLALELVREGAEDFILKNFSNPTDLFRRILYAVARSERTAQKINVIGTPKP